MNYEVNPQIMNWLFPSFIILGLVLGLAHTILSFMAKEILQSHGYKVLYFITEPFYEIRILKKLSKENPRYRTILTLHRMVSYLTLGLFLVMAMFAGVMVFR